MGDKSSRSRSEEKASDSSESSSDRAIAESSIPETDEEMENAGEEFVLGGPTRRSTKRGDVSASGDDAGSTGSYVDYTAGPDRQALSDRYGIAVGQREAGKLQRLEREHGREPVSRWVDEGMTVETMGKPRDMQAFRERQTERPEEVPTDVERRNRASRRRNKETGEDDGPAGEVGVPDEVRRVVSSPGRSMDDSVQREMESKMGGDFSDVQLHTGPEAAAAAESIGARAFTAGNHVAFNKGEYDPDSRDGKKILAHELTHVRQQTEGRVSLLPKSDSEYPGAGLSLPTGASVQPKLEVSSPTDPAEREAEEIAERVIEQDESTARTVENDEQSDDDQAECRSCADSSTNVSRSVSVDRANDGPVSADEESTIRGGVQGGGTALPSETRSFFESQFGTDFSDVRIHTDSAADEAARSINARAYTLGSDIAFTKGNYEPNSTDGKKLLAHELTHVVQQGADGSRQLPLSRSEQGNSETESVIDTDQLTTQRQETVHRVSLAVLFLVGAGLGGAAVAYSYFSGEEEVALEDLGGLDREDMAKLNESLDGMSDQEIAEQVDDSMFVDGTEFAFQFFQWLDENVRKNYSITRDQLERCPDEAQKIAAKALVQMFNASQYMDWVPRPGIPGPVYLGKQSVQLAFRIMQANQGIYSSVVTVVGATIRHDFDLMKQGVC